MSTGKICNILRARAVAVPNETVEQKLHRAKAYPYARPTSSFLFIDGSAYEFDSSAWNGIPSLSTLLVTDPTSSTPRKVADLDFHEAALQSAFTPVLAIGSNAAPEQLRRKFPPSLFPDGIFIPVVECVLEDFDVVYSPTICSYGACPATLEHSPGTSVSVYITYLDPAALQRMHETEGTYDLLQLLDIRLHAGASSSTFRQGDTGREVLTSVYQYNHQHGSLHLPVAGYPGGVPVSLSEIPAANRRFPALTQPQMLQAIRHIFAGCTSQHVHIHAEISDMGVDFAATRLAATQHDTPQAGVESSKGSPSGSQRESGHGSRGFEVVGSSDEVCVQVVDSDGTAVTQTIGVSRDQDSITAVAWREVHLPSRSGGGARGASSNNGCGGGSKDGSLSMWMEQEGLDEWVMQMVSRGSTRVQVNELLVKCAKGFRYQKAQVMAHLGAAFEAETPDTPSP